MALIHEKMAALLAEPLVIGKDQYNEGQRYKFRGVDDTYLAVKPLLAKHEVFCTPEVLSIDRSEYQTAKGATMCRIILTVRHRFYATDGSSVDVTTVGEGADSGDKGSYKALSGAYKYALWEALCIPTEESKDAENDNPDGPAAPAPRPRAAAPSKPAPKPRSTGKEESSHSFDTGESMRFGKYKGKDYGHIPSKYLRQLVSSDGWVDGAPGPFGPDCGEDEKYGDANMKIRRLIAGILKKRKELESGTAEPDEPPPENREDQGGDLDLDIPFSPVDL